LQRRWKISAWGMPWLGWRMHRNFRKTKRRVRCGNHRDQQSMLRPIGRFLRDTGGIDASFASKLLRDR
jgi:hypothetical protein